MRLTKPQKDLLQIASDLGGTMKVFPDQRALVSVLEAHGFLIGNGKYIDRKATITDLGRSALAQSVEKK